MGCNESKHSVATDNAAISNAKKPNKRSHKNVVSPAESIPESAANATVEKESSPPAKQPELENLNTVTTKSSNNNIDEITPKATETASDVKDIRMNLNETTPTPNAVIIEERKIEENLNNIVSQDQSSDREEYLNSRKERGSIDSIVSDNDGYYSPHHELPTSREGRDDDHASEELDVKIDAQHEVEGVEENGKELLAQEHQNEKETEEVVVEALPEKESNVKSPSTKEANDVTKIAEKQSIVNVAEATPSGLQQEAQTAT